MKAFKHYKRLKSATSLRLKLGLSQQAFARQIGISKSLVSMVENGRRSLPTQALLKIAELETTLAALEKSGSASLPGVGRATQKAPGFRNKPMRAKINGMKHSENGVRLARMIERYQKTTDALRKLEFLLDASGMEMTAAARQLWEISYNDLCVRLRSCDANAQAKLKATLARLEVLVAVQGDETLPETTTVGQLTEIDGLKSSEKTTYIAGTNVIKQALPNPYRQASPAAIRHLEVQNRDAVVVTSVSHGFSTSVRYHFV